MNHEFIQEISENENPKKIVNINEKIIDFNKQQKGKGRPLDIAKRISKCLKDYQ